MTKKFIEDLIILKNRRLNPDYFVIDLGFGDNVPEILPGQFAEVLIENSSTVFLRRPLSIHDVNYKEKTMSLLVQIVGEGTTRLAYVEEGDYLNLVYPLGKGFSYNENNHKVLLIGGGCGVAPLLYLARVLSENNIEVNILIGVKSKEQLILTSEYKKYGNIFITTEDGSEGEQGYVVNHSLFNNLSSFDKIYTCGPEVMMKAIAKRALEAGVDCEVSLENLMACGVGACLCCVTETTEGRKCVCTEGPVFNVKELSW